MKTIRLLIVDKSMNTTEIEINTLQFKSMGIDLSKVKKHDKKRDLNNSITEFLESFEENKKV